MGAFGVEEVSLLGIVGESEGVEAVVSVVRFRMVTGVIRWATRGSLSGAFAAARSGLIVLDNIATAQMYLCKREDESAWKRSAPEALVETFGSTMQKVGSFGIESEEQYCGPKCKLKHAEMHVTAEFRATPGHR